MAIHSTRDTGGEPNTWDVKLFANISAAEEFVCQLVAEMQDLVDATMIVEPNRQQVKEAILSISVHRLWPAFEHLKKIRADAGRQVPILNRKQPYEDMSRDLWVAYKTLTQQATALIGHHIGFLYDTPERFESGAIAFENAWPSAPKWFIPYLREQRARWQDELNAFRTSVEHPSLEVRRDFSHHYTPEHAEMIFEAVWRTVADILAVLLGMHMHFALVEIPANERAPYRRTRFRFGVWGLSSAEELNRLFVDVGPLPR